MKLHCAAMSGNEQYKINYREDVWRFARGPCTRRTGRPVRICRTDALLVLAMGSRSAECENTMASP
jgi:hypothetical protein